MTAVRRQPGASMREPSQHGTPESRRNVDNQTDLTQPRRSTAVSVVLLAMAMVVIDGGLSNAALPTIAAALRVKPSAVILVMTAYQAAVVMMLLPSAALGERFGYRLVFTVGAGVFSAASLASALAPSLPWLVAARFLQGLGGSAILALGVALLRLSVSDGRLGAAIGWNALTVALSAAAGPAIGALIISVADWHWLYLVTVPVGVAVIMATRALPFVEPQDGRLDSVSVILNCAAFGSVVVGTNTVSTAPLMAGGVFLFGILAFAVLVTREKPKTRPLIPIDLLRNTSFAVSVVASICCFTGQTAGLIALPFFLQNELEQTPAAAALYMVVWPLGVAVTAPLAGRLVRHVPTGRICAIGAALVATGLATIVLWPLKDDPRLVAPFLAMCGAGFGLFQVANNRNMFLAAPPARSAAAGGMQGTARLTGQTAGTLLVAQLFLLMPVYGAPQFAISFGAAFALAAGFISLFRTTGS